MIMDWMISIGLIVLANLTILIARSRKRGFIRTTLSIIAFSMLLPAFLFAVRALM